MALGVKLIDLVRDLRAEVGHSLAPAQGLNTEESLMYLLNRVQQQLWVEYDWPMRRANVYIELFEGQAKYDYPWQMNFNGIESVSYTPLRDSSETQSAKWRPLEYDVRDGEYLLVVDDIEARKGPPQRWAHNSAGDKFQVWPAPDQHGWVRLHGQRISKDMRLAEDKCELDSVLIVMRAAAEIASRQKMADANIKVENVGRFALKLLARQRSLKTKPFIIGGPAPGYDITTRPMRRGIDYVE